jgi:hypothetical protein
MATPLYFTGTLITKGQAPEELKSQSKDADVFGYASVEVEDLDGDIIRVDGIRLNRHKPDNRIKLLAGHQRLLADGSSPIIGSICNFTRVTHPNGAKALAFGAKFGSTPLAKEYATLYDDEHTAPEFSIGFRPVRSEPMKNGNGLDYLESELIEVSSVTLGANQYAQVMRALYETHPDLAGGDDSAAAMFRTIVNRMDDIECGISVAIEAAATGANPCKAFHDGKNKSAESRDNTDDDDDDDDLQSPVDQANMKRILAAVEGLRDTLNNHR